MICDNKLIFIISQPRSGSTLLQAILSNHNKIDTISEPWISLPFLTLLNTDIIRAKYDEKIASEAILDFLDKQNAKPLFETSVKEALLKLYDTVQTNSNNFVLDKTPRYYEILDDLIKFFPVAKIIILKRNPFAVLNSIIDTWNQNSYEKLAHFYRDICEAPKKLHHFITKHRNNSNVFTLQYEKIIQSPEQCIKQVSNFIDIDFNQDIIDYSTNNSFKGIFGDQQSVQSKSRPSQNEEKWVNKLSNSYWKPFFENYSTFLGDDFIKSYGYDPIVKSSSNKVFNYFEYLYNKTHTPQSTIKHLKEVIYTKTKVNLF